MGCIATAVLILFIIAIIMMVISILGAVIPFIITAIVILLIIRVIIKLFCKQDKAKSDYTSETFKEASPYGDNVEDVKIVEVDKENKSKFEKENKFIRSITPSEKAKEREKFYQYAWECEREQQIKEHEEQFYRDHPEMIEQQLNEDTDNVMEDI